METRISLQINPASSFLETSSSKHWSLPGAEISFCAGFFSPEESRHFFRELYETIEWKQEKIYVFGRRVSTPRLTAWHGDEGKSYRYSGITVHPCRWTPALLQIKDRVETSGKQSYNSVLLNLYRDGQDSVDWHADDEKELGWEPVIGSVSFGATRQFQLKHREDKRLRLNIDLSDGSYVVMSGQTQHQWLHRIPKTAKPCPPRINLTFRTIC